MSEEALSDQLVLKILEAKGLLEECQLMIDKRIDGASKLRKKIETELGFFQTVGTGAARVGGGGEL